MLGSINGVNGVSAFPSLPLSPSRSGIINLTIDVVGELTWQAITT